MPSLVQIMACRLFGDKPLSEPMIVQSTDTYMRHSASMSKQNVMDIFPMLLAWTKLVNDKDQLNLLVNTIVSPDLTIQGASTSVAMILTCFFQNTSNTTPKGQRATISFMVLLGISYFFFLSKSNLDNKKENDQIPRETLQNKLCLTHYSALSF